MKIRLLRNHRLSFLLQAHLPSFLPRILYLFLLGLLLPWICHIFPLELPRCCSVFGSKKHCLVTILGLKLFKTFDRT